MPIESQEESISSLKKDFRSPFDKHSAGLCPQPNLTKWRLLR